jgi:hypothetical protein
VPAQVAGWRPAVDSLMPFCAASVTSCVQEVPCVMAMNMSGLKAWRWSLVGDRWRRQLEGVSVL